LNAILQSKHNCLVKAHGVIGLTFSFEMDKKTRRTLNAIDVHILHVM